MHRASALPAPEWMCHRRGRLRQTWQLHEQYYPPRSGWGVESDGSLLRASGGRGCEAERAIRLY